VVLAPRKSTEQGLNPFPDRNKTSKEKVEGLKAQATAAVKWTGVGSLMRQTFQFGISIVLARLLTPEDFGVVTILIIISAIGNTVSEGGFGQALIHAKEVSSKMIVSVLVINACLSLIFSCILLLSGDHIAGFFDVPQIAKLVPIFALSIVISGLGAVPGALLARELRFKDVAIINSAAAALSGSIAIVFAACGWGAWSLAFQSLAFVAVTTTGFWLRNTYRISSNFSIREIRKLGSFGVYVLSANLLETLLGRLNAICIGRFYNPTDLGYYARAESTQALPSGMLSSVINQTAFPLLTSVKQDEQRMKRVFQTISEVTYYVYLPAMLGLAIIAEPLVLSLFGVKWKQAIPFLQVFALAGAPWLPRLVNCSLLKAVGKPRAVLVIEAWQKVLIIVAVFITVPISSVALVWGQAVVSALSLLISMLSVRACAHIPMRAQASAAVTPMLATLGMCALLFSFQKYVSLPYLAELIVLVVAGIIAYVTICYVLNVRAQKIVFQTVFGKLNKAY
jgi:teichuronic acid exporter